MRPDAARLARGAVVAALAIVGIVVAVGSLAPAAERFAVDGAPVVAELADGGRIEERTLVFGQRRVRVRIASATRARLRVLDQPQRIAAAFADAVRATTAVAAVDGGYFDRDFAPDGLLRVAGREAHAFDRSGPSGVLAIDERGCVIVPRAQWPPANPPRDALQAGPLLVDPGGQVGIRSDSGGPVERSAVALGADGAPRLVSTGPALLRDVALILADPQAIGFACERALNLDGGPSAALAWRAAAGWQVEPPTGPVRSIVLLEAGE